ncbi:laccase-4-like isoform X2 [Contarinia nasturtii]|uniref:laccase-4-like isoform X2 n=1 Tax=Contarinia nasturtii TaxID=265458 RepID=UPI0012D413AF|nr:laccase-4-like isoform X2 [Contarinia nasturtii]
MVLQCVTKKSIIIVFFCLIPLTMGSCGPNCHCGTNCQCKNKYLSTMELMERFGQEGTKFNDSRSCWRVCDGKPRTCYYHLMFEHYDTMSGLCLNCPTNMTDCYNSGCLPTNGVQRVVTTINRGIPGPGIHVCKGDRIIADVMNHMHGCETSVHWHGILQTKTPHMDGVQMVTQCPIPSGTTFRYDFECPEPGTNWYHSHSGVQRTDGIFGALVIRNEKDPNADCYDTDLPQHTIIVSDWMNQMGEAFMPGTRNGILRPDSILINGCGTFNPLIGNATYAPIAVFYVQRYKKSLIRLINAGSQNCPTEIHIQGCKLKVIASDTYSVYPVIVDRIVCQPGERFDFVIEPPEDKDQILMVARALGGCARLLLQEFAKFIVVGNVYTHKGRIEDHQPLNPRPSYLSLEDANATYLNHPNTDCSNLNGKDYCIARLVQKGATCENLRNAKIAKRINLEFRNSVVSVRPSSYLTVGNNVLRSMINNISFIHPWKPILTQNYSDVPFCDAEHLPLGCSPTTICECIQVIKLELCKIYEFHVYDTGVPGGAISHPFHLHGYGFQVCDMGTRAQLENGTTPYPNLKYAPPIKLSSYTYPYIYKYIRVDS